MRVKITSICSEETLRPLNAFYTKLEDAVNDYLRDMSFGDIGLLMISIVSAFDDESENCKFADTENKIGSFVDPFTKVRVKFITLGLAYPPSRVVLASASELRENLCNAILNRLMGETMAKSKKFDFPAFAQEFKIAVEIYKRSAE